VGKLQTILHLSLFLSLAATAMAGTQTPAAADWPGWRGLDAQGVSKVAAPIAWSATENIAWQTPLPGEGHSSPVVVGGRVFLTAARKDTNGPRTRLLATLALAGAAVVMAFLLLPLACCSWALLVCLGLFGYSLFQLAPLAQQDANWARYFQWLHSFVALGMATMVSVITPGVRRLGRAGLGVVLFLLAGLLLWLRPQPQYYRLVLGDYWGYPTLGIFGLLVLAGAVVILGAVTRPQMPAADPAERPLSKARRLRLLLQGAVILILALMGFGVTTMYPGGPPGSGLLEWRCVRLWPYVIGLVLLLASVIGPKRQAARPQAAYIGPAAILLAGLAFIVVNFIGWRDVYTRMLLSLDRNNGKVLWCREDLRGPKPTGNELNSAATPSPVAADGRIFAWFGAPGMVCADFGGNVLWRNLDLPFSDFHGVAASPVVADGLLIVASGNPKAPYIAALQAQNGERVWTAKLPPWKGNHGEHRTPLVWQGKVLHWSMVGNVLSAYDLHSGRELWSWPVPMSRAGEAIASITADGSTLYLCNKLATLCVRVGDKPSVAWKANMKGRGANCSSPVLGDGLLYIASDTGYASCLDTQTGKLLWSEHIGSGCLASLVLAEDRVYFPCQDGTVVVVATGRQFREVARNALPGHLYASPAPNSGTMILRTTQGLWCIGPALPPPRPAAAQTAP
jgi:outer membrane protein assembly factor BamB